MERKEKKRKEKRNKDEYLGSCKGRNGRNGEVMTSESTIPLREEEKKKKTKQKIHIHNNNNIVNNTRTRIHIWGRKGKEKRRGSTKQKKEGDENVFIKRSLAPLKGGKETVTSEVKKKEEKDAKVKPDSFKNKEGK